MAISDNIVFRLKPTAGQVAPTSMAAGGEVLSGGAFSLVDRGSGDLAWQFTGGDTVANIASKTSMAAAGDGMTVAITLKVVTNPTADFTRYCGVGSGTTPPDNSGFRLGQNGANAIRAGLTVGANAFNDSLGAAGASELTYVMRLRVTSSAAGAFDSWKQTSGRPGTAADATIAVSSAASFVNSAVWVRSAASDVIQIKDFVVWHRELTDVECANVADALRATIDAGAAPAVNLAIANLATVSTLSTGAATVTAAVAGVTNLAISNLASANTLSTVAATVTPVQGTITSDIFAAWGSPAPLANLSIPRIVVLKLADGTIVINLANQATDANGRIVLTSASLVSGSWYMLGTWNADGSARGFKAYQAA